MSKFPVFLDWNGFRCLTHYFDPSPWHVKHHSRQPNEPSQTSNSPEKKFPSAPNRYQACEQGKENKPKVGKAMGLGASVMDQWSSVMGL